VESHFNPFARSPAGAQGIAQFMPGTAAAYGLTNPFDADRAIDAQAHLMRDLLRVFASVPLALGL
jgi:soluble lytic murein transglycosylase-like protein